MSDLKKLDLIGLLNNVAHSAIVERDLADGNENTERGDAWEALRVEVCRAQIAVRELLVAEGEYEAALRRVQAVSASNGEGMKAAVAKLNRAKARRLSALDAIDGWRQ